MLRAFLFLWLILGASAAAMAQDRPAPADPWARTGDRIALVSAAISFPETAGPVSFRESSDLGGRAEGVDNVLQFISDDRQVFATAYVYYPGLAHAGLTAFVTDDVIRLNSGSEFRSLGRRIVSAGGHEGVAIRSDYSGVREDRWASSAAFMKVGRWIVKLRVSGPQTRQSDVDRAMTALLDGIRFDGRLQPRAAVPLEISECRATPDVPGRIVPSEPAQVMEFAIIGTLDGAGGDARDERGNPVEPGPARMGTSWCQSSRLRIGNSAVTVLRAVPNGAGGIGGRSVLIVPIGDAGTTLEIVRLTDSNRFVALYHQIGRTTVLATYDGPLSDDQVAAILSGSDSEATRIRASVQHLPNGNTNINVVTPPEPTRSTAS